MSAHMYTYVIKLNVFTQSHNTVFHTVCTVCLSCYSLALFLPCTLGPVIPPPQAQQENELNRLKADLLEMKKQRVKMLNQMRTEATTKKLEDQRKSKEIAQLKKDSQKKECRIKSLEAEAKKKEFVLKRRQEEVWLGGGGHC